MILGKRSGPGHVGAGELVCLSNEPAIIGYDPCGRSSILRTMNVLMTRSVLGQGKGRKESGQGKAQGGL